MVDIESSIFDQVAEDFSAAYPNGSRYGEPNDAPAKFPALVIYEADEFYSGYNGLNAKRIAIDVDVYSDLTSGAKQECKAIMELVENRLMSIGPFEQLFCNQIRNADQRIFRMKSRFRCTAVQEKEIDGNVTVRIYKK